MAKTTLPTNYVDDVLNGAMDGKRRYREIPNADGTISLEDATTYDQIGSNFGASQVNLMNDNINQSFDANKMLKTMDEVNAVTQEGYGVDALVVKQLNNSLYSLDFDNAVPLTPNAPFTPNSSGYVIVFAQSTGTYGNVGLILGNSYASIQDNSEKWLCTSQQINGYNLGINMIVTKGQTYYFHAETVTLFSARFVPFK